MVSVVRLQRLHLKEAEVLIEQAGELIEQAGDPIDCSLPNFRHNYSQILSSYSSAREPIAMALRMQQQRQLRDALCLQDIDSRDYRLVVIAANSGAAELMRTLDSLEQLA